MRIQITVKQQNKDFDKEYAEEYNFGKGSHGNWKDKWSEGYEITKPIDDVHIFKNTEYSFSLESGELIKLVNVNILTAYKNDEIVERFIISKSIIQRMLKPPVRENTNTERYYFYLKPNKEIYKLSSNIYLNNDEVPESILNSTK